MQTEKVIFLFEENCQTEEPIIFPQTPVLFGLVVCHEGTGVISAKAIGGLRQVVGSKTEELSFLCQSALRNSSGTQDLLHFCRLWKTIPNSKLMYTRVKCVQHLKILWLEAKGGWAKASEQGERRQNLAGRCRLVFQALSPFMISIPGCSWLPLPALGCCLPPPPKVVSLYDFHSGLLLGPAGLLVAALSSTNQLPFMIFFWAALSPKLVSLHDVPSGLLLAAAAALSPKLVSLRDFFSGLLLATAAALSPKLVSLYDFLSGLLALGRCCRLVSQACLSLWSPFWAALGCRCPLVSQACLSLWSPFWAALGCRCPLVSQASWYPFWAALAFRCVCQASHPSWFPFWTALGCRCRLLVAAAAALSPKLVSLGCRLLVAAAAILSPKLVSLQDFPSGLLLVAAATISSKLSPFLISLLGCSCLPQPPSLPCLFPFLISFLDCSWVPQPPCLLACFPSWCLCNGIFLKKSVTQST